MKYLTTIFLLIANLSVAQTIEGEVQKGENGYYLNLFSDKDIFQDTCYVYVFSGKYGLEYSFDAQPKFPKHANIGFESDDLRKNYKLLINFKEFLIDVRINNGRVKKTEVIPHAKSS